MSIFHSFEIISLWLWGVFTKNLNIERNCEKTIWLLPPTSVTFYLQIVIVIQLDPPPTYLGTVTKYSDFFFEGPPKIFSVSKSFSFFPSRIEMMRVKSVVDETPEAKDCDKEQHFPVKDCFNIDLAFLSKNNRSFSLGFTICCLRLKAD